MICIDLYWFCTVIFTISIEGSLGHHPCCNPWLVLQVVDAVYVVDRIANRLGALAKQNLPRKDLANRMQEVLEQTRSMTLTFLEVAKHRLFRSLMKLMNTQMTKDWFTRLFWTFDMVASCLTGFVFSDGAFDTISIVLSYVLRCWEQSSGFFWVWKLF